mmetsp:Transcript_35574/g.78995  ORF Transcript_35574/g.78995 Transcript_35574/m.78995 type:complete len:521 (+) Transcript_35574:131-1693(+)|eukprot:CAMPEP_0202916188 /NCGR_PEP_ID=MMETSP1392-20130828/67901_1 /ASSEMBLY_ACC=CAM_ASM_000868 /TAXON_ID=225041 /ORGANISM="Chlamydomonas chlamydogama, Strain SAG 11-48b" /LENGTH=520 /DNA_ID=CAMNT_0049608515 /DNA_START=83 /DNA_END=1645 /DNA_ORIENTATION=-
MPVDTGNRGTKVDVGPSSEALAFRSVDYITGNYLVLLILKDGVVSLASIVAKALSISVRLVISCLKKLWGSRHRLAALIRGAPSTVSSWIQAALASKVGKAVVAAVTSVICLQLNLKTQRSPSTVATSRSLAEAAVGVHISLLFGILKLGTTFTLQLGWPSLPQFSSSNSRAATAPAQASKGSSTGWNGEVVLHPGGSSPGDEVRLICSKEFQDHILMFLRAQAQVTGAGANAQRGRAVFEIYSPMKAVPEARTPASEQVDLRESSTAAAGAADIMSNVSTGMVQPGLQQVDSTLDFNREEASTAGPSYPILPNPTPAPGVPSRHPADVPSPELPILCSGKIAEQQAAPCSLCGHCSHAYGCSSDGVHQAWGQHSSRCSDDASSRVYQALSYEDYLHAACEKERGASPAVARSCASDMLPPYASLSASASPDAKCSVTWHTHSHVGKYSGAAKEDSGSRLGSPSHGSQAATAYLAQRYARQIASAADCPDSTWLPMLPIPPRDAAAASASTASGEMWHHT